MTGPTKQSKISFPEYVRLQTPAPQGHLQARPQEAPRVDVAHRLGHRLLAPLGVCPRDNHVLRHWDSCAAASGTLRLGLVSLAKSLHPFNLNATIVCLPQVCLAGNYAAKRALRLPPSPDPLCRLPRLPPPELQLQLWMALILGLVLRHG